jgi:FAD/FMN-containing dehydrogenase
MVNNNSGGEKSLEFGKTEDFVTQLQVVFADGKEYTVKPLNRRELVRKMAQKNFEGRLYKQTFDLIEAHYDEIKAAKPKVSKNSTGYNLWDVWDRETGIFDLTKLIVGAQGTLGFVTDIHFRLVPKTDFSGVLVCFLKNTDELGNIINAVMAHKPAPFESFYKNCWSSTGDRPACGFKMYCHSPQGAGRSASARPHPAS